MNGRGDSGAPWGSATAACNAEHMHIVDHSSCQQRVMLRVQPSDMPSDRTFGLRAHQRPAGPQLSSRQQQERGVVVLVQQQ